MPKGLQPADALRANGDGTGGDGTGGDGQQPGPEIFTALDWQQQDPDYVPGRYASIDVSDQPMFGPDELAGYKDVIDQLTESATKTDSSSRIFEILQAWEARLFSRGYQFLLSGNKGWGLFGGAGRATPGSIMAEANARKLFACNVYGAREDKIIAALSREVPGLKFGPKDPDSPPDQTMADESDTYLEVWKTDSDIKGVLAKISRLFYTDGRAVLWTRSVADQQRWGTEAVTQDETFGAGEAEGVTPENEMQGAGEALDVGEGEVLPPGVLSDAESAESPAVCEITTAHGTLESKLPIYADEIFDMGHLRLAEEVDVDILRERYPWIEDKIEAGQSAAGSSDQYDRMARINVRLAVQNSTASGETFMKDATETHTWFRPSQYRMIKDKTKRAAWYKNFPRGCRITHAGSQFAFARNEGMDDHLTVTHARKGDGQNRRAIGANYLPLQKVLNQNLSLVVRYFVGCIPRRFAAEGPIDVDALNQQSSDPSIVTPVRLENPAQRIQDLTGIENVPTIASGLMEFVQWLVNGAPEAMDGATPTMFGQGDVGTVGESQLNRDQSLQVFGQPWAHSCKALAQAATQAAMSARANRKTDIRSRTPGQNKLTVQLANLKGNALCYPVSLEIPQTLAEQEAQTAQLVEQSANVALYKAIVEDPLNLPFFSNMPSLSGLNIPGLDAVEKQQGEFELLLESGPIDNPDLQQWPDYQNWQQLQQVVAEGETHPEAQTPDGAKLLAQAKQALALLQPPVPVKISSVPVAQDGSENHAVEAAVTLAKINSPEGRKLKNGDAEQQAWYQNLLLHWQQHEAIKKKLTPVPPLIPKVSITGAIDKAPPAVQAQAWQAVGVQAGPDDFTNAGELVPHEVTVEKEGVDASGVPVKQKISTVNPGGQLR
jgi:hypothetical protein